MSFQVSFGSQPCLNRAAATAQHFPTCPAASSAPNPLFAALLVLFQEASAPTAVCVYGPKWNTSVYKAVKKKKKKDEHNWKRRGSILLIAHPKESWPRWEEIIKRNCESGSFIVNRSTKCKTLLKSKGFFFLLFLKWAKFMSSKTEINRNVCLSN